MDFKPMLEKLFSGKYFLTIVTGIVFAYVSVKGIIGKDVIATIIVMVFTLYFTKQTNGGAK